MCPVEPDFAISACANFDQSKWLWAFIGVCLPETLGQQKLTLAVSSEHLDSRGGLAQNFSVTLQDDNSVAAVIEDTFQQA